MKKVFAAILSAVLICGCFAGCGNSGSSNSDTIKIGIFEPASGANGAGGKQ
ncbi:MAG TPA: branched-chain amino acid ABC transporter substrate-binding protein, partial [Ruminococcaceae bacterium]|nr:branched-chain amino acid ABC transporter substrate-binding protein [Oscillospiraceae bacterium]